MSRRRLETNSDHRKPLWRQIRARLCYGSGLKVPNSRIKTPRGLYSFVAAVSKHSRASNEILVPNGCCHSCICLGRVPTSMRPVQFNLVTGLRFVNGFNNYIIRLASGQGKTRMLSAAIPQGGWREGVLARGNGSSVEIGRFAVGFSGLRTGCGPGRLRRATRGRGRRASSDGRGYVGTKTRPPRMRK